jgi:predicted nucleotidyltransferase
MVDQVQQLQWTADSILQFLYQHRIELRAMGVVKIGLFGSYVRNEQRQNSDIDLLLTMDDFTWRRWNNVWNYIEDHLGVEVDLVPEKDLRPELQCYILPEVRYSEIG